MNVTSQAPRGSRLRTAAALAGVLVLAACASAPPAPTASLQAAQQAISTAERAEAGRYAAGELGEARTKLVSANTAVSEQRMIMAQQFAEDSRAEAELAAAKATDVKAQEVNEEMKRSTSTLVEEMRRTSGDKP
jgi:phage-related tail protein